MKNNNMLKTFTILILFIATFTGAYASSKIDYQQLNKEIDVCSNERTSSCFLNLLNKYKFNEIRYYYAISLENEKKLSQAKNELDIIVKTEKNNTKLIALAKEEIQKINDLNTKMRNANNADWGDYFSELDNTAKWRNARGLRVFVTGRTGKEYILNKAFQIWDNSVAEVSFTYVNSKENADIICYFVDRLNKGNAAGVTMPQMYQTPDGKKYLHKATVEISMYKPGTNGKYTDDNLLCITLHEIGHALGIISHSNNINDIMYPTTDTYQRYSISRRDINTIKKMYH